MPMDRTLSAKEEALVGIAASVASGCRPCTRSWIRAARQQGACERGVRLAVEAGLAVRETATRELADYAEAQQDTVPEVDVAFRAERTSLVEILSCAASIAVGSSVGLERHLDSARGHGATTQQLSAAVALGRAIRGEAGKQVEKVVQRSELEATPALAGSWCCETLLDEGSAPAEGCCCQGGRS